MLASSGLTLVAPYLFKVAIDDYIGTGNSAGLAKTALLIALSFLGIFVTTSGEEYLLSWVGQRVLASLRSRLFRHIQHLSLGYHDTHSTGVTISRVINDVAAIKELLSEGLITLIGDVLVLGGIISVMVSMNTPLALLAFSVLPLMILGTYLFARRAKIAFRHTRIKVASVVSDLAENITGMRVIQAFSQENLSQEKFDQVNSENRDAHISAMSLSFVFMPSIEFLSILAMAIVLWFGGLAVVRDTITIGVVVAFLSYVARFFQPVQELSHLYTTLQAAMAGGERVLELLDTEPGVKDRPGAGEMLSTRGRVELRNVSFSYTGKEMVLHNINLVIEPGQTVALVGPTGAGKTSIANLVARFYDTTEGHVLIDDIDVRDVTQRSLRKQMGIVNQDPFLFSGTIRDNITFGKSGSSESAVLEVARLARAHDFISTLPEGYDTEILEGGVNLSLGQRQLISIARAIYSNPRILIMDEATSSVDTVTEVLIQEALRELLAKRTTVVIAHRLSTVREADMIYVIQDGHIVEVGKHGDLVERDGLYCDLYERQFIR
jgi:ABC-type multidrug transport system fused ATPase/permease subunit